MNAVAESDTVRSAGRKTCAQPSPEWCLSQRSWTFAWSTTTIHVRWSLRRIRGFGLLAARKSQLNNSVTHHDCVQSSIIVFVCIHTMRKCVWYSVASSRASNISEVAVSMKVNGPATNPSGNETKETGLAPPNLNDRYTFLCVIVENWLLKQIKWSPLSYFEWNGVR